MIVLDPFWELMKSRGITVYKLEYDYNLNPAEISRLIHNHNFTLSSIDRYCKIFSCQPTDIIKYIDKSRDQ